jgi:hypothetical protein
MGSFGKPEKLCILYTKNKHHIEDFKAKYPEIMTGKACINFKVTDPVPIAALKKVIKHAMEQDQ